MIASPRTSARLALAVLFAAIAAPRASTAQSTATIVDPLGLATLKDYEARRATSNNLYVESNDDSKRPVPGETIVLADLTGPGVVTHIWMTLAANEYGWPRLLRFRVYYDGSATPSIDVPLGDFFAAGHGYERNVESLLIRSSSNGRARNSYWPMPFRKSIRITVTNEGSRRVSMLYYQVDWQKHRRLPATVGYLHAFYKQEIPAAGGRDYTVLDVKGRGHLVGALVNVVQTETGWFGEGDDLFYVDGYARPVLEGTGTEDYFLDAWSLRTSSGLLAGVPIAEGRDVGARISGYRWHVTDPVPFTTRLRFDIEHKGWKMNSDPKFVDGFRERFDLWSSVAFWYQQGVNESLPEPPYGAARLPHGNARQIEVEDLADRVAVEGGRMTVQREVFWSKDLLTLQATAPGARMTIPLDVPDDGYYEVIAQVASASDYGTYSVVVEGPSGDGGRRALSAPRIIDAWGPELYVAADHLLGWMEMKKGRYDIVFTGIGRNAASRGYLIGVDDIVLSRVTDDVRPGRTPAAAEASALPVASARDRASARGLVTYRGLPAAAYLSRLAAPLPAVRAAAARALGAFLPGDASPLPRLIALLDDGDVLVRQAAMESLAMAGPAAVAAVPRLAQLLSDASPRSRILAALALREVGRSSIGALPQLTAALGDPDLTVRYEVGLALAALGPAAKPAVPALMAAMDEAPDDWVSVIRRDVRRSMAIALGEIGPDAREALSLLRKWMAFYRVAWIGEPVIRKIEGRPAPATYRPGP